MTRNCYCAICGGPNVPVCIAKRPRSEEFKRRLQTTIAKRKAENIPDHEHVNLVMVDPEPERPPLPYDEKEEVESYDPDILTKEDTAWSQTFYAVALRTYNNNVEG
jgi:hypothetical protein